MGSVFKIFSPFLIGVLISAGIGLIIGLEREYNKLDGKVISGIRTFPLVCIFGFLIAELSTFYSWIIIAVTLPAFLLFLGIDHLRSNGNSVMGHTTHMSLMIVFVLGIMVSLQYYKESLAVAVFVLSLLALKHKFQSILTKISQDELYATVKFFVLSLLILPFLPNETFGPGEILNFYEIGWVVVVISIINFVGYFLMKFIGSKKGILATGILGGLISSTAVAWNFARQSKENKTLSHSYSAGILIASSIMFPRLAIIATIFNPQILSELWLPFSLMFISTSFYAVYLNQKLKTVKSDSKEISLGNPLDILSALYFTILFLAILLAAYFSNLYLGDRGLYLSSIVSGLADTDAITITSAKLSVSSEISYALAVNVILAAVLSNSLVKFLIGFFRGSNSMRKELMIGFGLPFLIGAIYILIKL